MLTTLIVLFPPLALAVYLFVLYRRRGAELESLEKNLDDAYAYKRAECQKRDEKISQLLKEAAEQAGRSEQAGRFINLCRQIAELKRDHSLRIANYQRQSLSTCAQYATDAKEFITIPGFSDTTRELVDKPIQYGQANFQSTKLSKPDNVRTPRTPVPDSGCKP